MKLRPYQVLALVVASLFVMLACQLDQYLPQQDIPTLVPTDVPPVAVPRSKSPTASAASKGTPIPIRIYAVATTDQQVYTSPATNSKVLSALAKGNGLQVVGRTEKNDWWQVVLPGSQSQQGWVTAKTTTLNGPIDSIPIVQFTGGTPHSITNTPPKATATVPQPTLLSVPTATRPAGPVQPTPTSRNPYQHEGF